MINLRCDYKLLGKCRALSHQIVLSGGQPTFNGLNSNQRRWKNIDGQRSDDPAGVVWPFQHELYNYSYRTFLVTPTGVMWLLLHGLCGCSYMFCVVAPKLVMWYFLHVFFITPTGHS